MGFNERLKELRTNRSMTQEQLANIINLSTGTIASLENGRRQPSYDVLLRLASFFDVSIDYLVGKSDIPYLQERGGNARLIRTDPLDGQRIMRVPILGTIRGGEPIYTDENILGYIDYPVPNSTQDKDYIALEVTGDSMTPTIPEGSVVIVKLQPTCENNDICAVRINEDEATIKRVKIYPDGLFLIPSNPAYTPKFYTKKDIDNLPISIIGVVKSFSFKF